MNIVEYADQEMLAMHVADLLASELKKCLMQHDFASFAVPGGASPGPIFDILSGIRFDWEHVHVMLTDERWVPEEDPRSNTALVRERLLTGHAADAKFIPFYAPNTNAVEGAKRAARRLEGELPISLLLLGMGTDMHTASLFPGAEGLEEAMAHHAPALCRIKAPDQDIERVTLSAETLKGAMSTHLVIYGAEKREALEKARRLRAREAPIAAVLGSGTVHWAP
ncbi:MAG: 6-phosphogluconolactonase [Sulfitobacter sp.]|nr:6-phosphogluconolactonase [Sulfitobacter sp.]